MDIRTVTVELLRAGPRHNQLLSPLTQYLGVCGDASAGTVTLPYEHRDLELRLQDLSYRVVADDDLTRRQSLLDRTGQEMADILSRVPGLSGALNSETERSQTLTQLRIVLSASELAMLPFELSKVPAGAGSPGVWLALQARTPVCITRHIRSVSAEGMRWPIDPRILYVAGPQTPFEEHRQALLRAMAPWCNVEGSLGDRLVILEHATVADIADEVATAAQNGAPFTHVHVLAHGASLDDADPYSQVGVALHDEVISGSRLATALTSVTDRGVGRPAVVTLATCDSAKVADVRTPDASVAHDLHDRGIPLVVASQFPLSVEGSIPFVERFYDGQLWGEHPLASLYDVRLRLHGCMGQEVHDWASLVVYEAFPSDLTVQLEELRYWQARRAQDRALNRLEALVSQVGSERPGSGRNAGAKRSQGPSAPRTQELYAGLVTSADAISARLPERGPYALECAGLRAAGYKRIAQVAFQLAVAPGVSKHWGQNLLSDCARRLDEARAEYWRATKSFLGPSSELTRKKANLHWLLGQVLSLDVVLGRPFDTASWTAARLAARIDTENPDEIDRAWAYVSLSELALLRLADKAMPAGERAGFADEALANAARVLDLLGRGSEHAMTTSRQFERYIAWWGNPDFGWALAMLGVPERQHWRQEYGLVPTATRLVQLFRAPYRPVSRSTADAGRGKSGRATVPSTTGDLGVAAAATRPASSSPPGHAKVRDSAASLAIEMLPAENGDCLWIEYGDPKKPRRILIDCGAASTARTVASRITAIGKPSERSFEVFVLTHIDADHINGVLPLFANRALNARFEDIWFNGWRQVNRFLSVKQGEEFSRLLEDPKRGLPWNRAISSAADKYPAPMVLATGAPLPSFNLPDGMRLTLLSPGASQLKRLGQEWKRALLELYPEKAMLGRKPPPPPVRDFAAFDLEALASTPARKDPSVANGSSIALLAEFDGRSLLFTGDAHADVLTKSIKELQRERGREGEKLRLDALKLSHHGSANATTIALLELLDCPRYLVSSNGNIFNHPDREAIARVIIHGGERPTLCFNYRSALNALWDEPILRERYDYLTVYPQEHEDGLRLSL